MELVYYVGTSLDGFIASPEGGLDWLNQFESCGDDHGYQAFFATVDSLIVGRKTYDQILSFGEWPYSEKTTLLFTANLSLACPNQVIPFDKSPAEGLKVLESLGKKRAWLIGGSQLAAAFRKLGLIDEYLISVIPLILGGGIPLFEGTGPLEKLALLESRSFRSGLAQLHYRKVPPAIPF